MTAARAPYVDPDDLDADDLRRIVKPAPHEFRAHYNFNSHGLDPWFGCDRLVKHGGGAVSITFDALGDTWTGSLYVPDGCGLLPPADGETPAGTPVEHDSIREFRFAVEADDDTGERKANFHIRPRWAGLTAETDDGDTTEIGVPDSLANTNTDAVNVVVAGSNVEFHHYGTLLREAADAAGLSPRYFQDRHRTSNVQDAARYLRIDRDSSGPIHAPDGPLAGLSHVLQTDRSGFRKYVQDDSGPGGSPFPGYYVTATLGPDRVREVFPAHALPVECKHYYARDARGRDDGDPLAHPKLEVAYQASRWSDTLHAADDDLDQLSRELDEWLYAILADAGLDLRDDGDDGDDGGSGVYVEDAYFEPHNATTTANVVSLDLTEIRHEQESIIYRHLADGLSPAEQDTLTRLVSDGGRPAPKEIADDTDHHLDTIYDALGRLRDLVEHTRGSVELASPYVAELVSDALREAEQATERATLATVEAAEAERRGLDERTSAFLAWCETHGVNYDAATDDEMKIDLGEVEDPSTVRQLLREGLRLWEQMNRDLATFRESTVVYQVPDRSRRLRSIDYDDDPPLKPAVSDVWRLL